MTPGDFDVSAPTRGETPHECEHVRAYGWCAGECVAPLPPSERTEGGTTEMVKRLAALLKRAEAQITEHHSSHHVQAFAKPGVSLCPACDAMATRHHDGARWVFFEDVRRVLADAASLATPAVAPERDGEAELRVAVRTALVGDDPEMPPALAPLATLAAAVQYAVDMREKHRAEDDDPDASWELLSDAGDVLRDLNALLPLLASRPALPVAPEDATDAGPEARARAGLLRRAADAVMRDHREHFNGGNPACFDGCNADADRLRAMAAALSRATPAGTATEDEGYLRALVQLAGTVTDRDLLVWRWCNVMGVSVEDGYTVRAIPFAERHAIERDVDRLAREAFVTLHTLARGATPPAPPTTEGSTHG